MSPDSQFATLLGQITDEFTERQQRGERPDVTEYLTRYPELGEVLRRVLPMVQALGPSSSPSTLPKSPTPAVTGPVSVPGFEVIKELGRGGMGVVYLARQTNLGRLTALKMIRAGATADEADLDRFRSEARAVARLSHPNIVQVYQVGECASGDGRSLPFLAMEYVEGGSLEAQMNGKPWAARRAAELVETLARAMDAAHQQGIVHRDLKPGNVLLSCPSPPAPLPQGERGVMPPSPLAGEGPGVRGATPKITDFGLAKVLDTPHGHTQTGHIVGTPSYMAPEQASGLSKHVGPLADVYSLGAILYDLLTGRPPFQGESLLQTLDMVRNQEPVPPARLNPGVPLDLDTITLKCLQKEIGRRYGSARELADDLRRFLDGRPITARPVGPGERLVRWCRRNPGIAGLIGAVVASLAAGLVVSLVLLDQAVSERNRADENARKENNALQAQLTAEANARSQAERDAAAIRRQVVQSCMTQGRRLADDGDTYAALLWLAEPFVRDPDNRDLEPIRRMRLASHLGIGTKPVLKQMWFHDGPVGTIAFSPDGKRVVSASEDGTARVWEVRTGKPLGEPLRHEGKVYHASFSPDGERVATASLDGTARVWNAADGQPATPPLRHPPAGDVKPLFLQAVFSPNGGLLLTSGFDRRARLWNADDGRPLGVEMIHPSHVHDAVFSHDGTLIATACQDGTVRVWKATTGEPVTEPLTHSTGQPAWHVEFSPDGRRLVSTGFFGPARVWDVQTGKPLGDPLAEVSWAARFSPDCRRIVTASPNATARVWDAETGEPVSPVLKHRGRVVTASFDKTGDKVLTASVDGTARVWEAATGRPLGPTLRHGHFINAAEFSPDGRRVVTAGEDQTVRLWENQETAPPLTLGPHGVVKSAVWMSDGREVRTVTLGKAVHRWDVESGQAVGKPVLLAGFDLANGEISSFSADGQLVALVRDGKLHLRDAMTGGVAAFTMDTQTKVLSTAFSADGKRLVTGCDDGTVRLWEIESGRAVGEVMHHDREVKGVAISKDGGRMLGVGRDNLVKVWELSDGREVGPPLSHPDLVTSASFSPDGRRVVTSSFDGAARVWDTVTGEMVSQPCQHEQSVNHVAMSPDGRLLVTASEDNTARVWDAATGEAITPSIRIDKKAKHGAFSPDGKRVLTVSEDGTVQVWDLTRGDRSPAEWLATVRLLHGHRLGEGFNLHPLNKDELRRGWEQMPHRSGQR